MSGCVFTGADGLPISEVAVDDQQLTVLVADSTSERRQGLRDVPVLPRGIDGMLFVFEDPVVAFFTSEDTLIALDLWWFDASGRLVGSADLEPCAGDDCPDFSSPGQIQWVLETPDGLFTFDDGAVLEVDADD